MTKRANERSTRGTERRTLTWMALGFVTMSTACAGGESVAARTVSTERKPEQLARAERTRLGDATAWTWQAVPTERKPDQAARAERTMMEAGNDGTCIPWRQPVPTERQPEQVARAERQVERVMQSSRADSDCL